MINIWLNIFLAISVLGVLLTQFFMPENPSSFAEKIITITFNMSYSYIIAYIFYLVAFIPDRKNKTIMHKHVLSRSNFIKGKLNGMLNELAKASNVAGLSDNEIKTICSMINPHGQAPLIVHTFIDQTTNKIQFTYASWAEFIVYYKEEIQKAIDEIKSFSSLADTELLDNIMRIQDSDFFMIVDSFLKRAHTTGNQNLSTMEKQFINIRNLSEELDNRNKIVAKKYKPAK